MGLTDGFTPGLQLPPQYTTIIAGRLYTPGMLANVNPLRYDLAPGAFLSNIAYYSAFRMDQSATLGTIQVRTTAAHSATGTAHCNVGIYTDVNGVPSTLLAQTGQLSLSSASSVYSAAGLNTPLSPGIYWRLFVTDIANSAGNFLISEAPAASTGVTAGLPLGGTNTTTATGYGIIAALTYSSVLPTAATVSAAYDSLIRPATWFTFS